MPTNKPTKKPGALTVMVGVPGNPGPAASTEQQEADLRVAAQAMILAIQKGSAEELVDAFKAMKELCSSYE